jgi:hypothetical protein
MDISTFQDRIEQIVHMIRLLQFAVREDEIDSATGNLDYVPCKGWAKIKRALKENLENCPASQYNVKQCAVNPSCRYIKECQFPNLFTTGHDADAESGNKKRS